jgi:hypothetical protein
MSRLQAVPFGTGVLLVPDWCHPTGDQRIASDQRIVRPTRPKESRRVWI